MSDVCLHLEGICSYTHLSLEGKQSVCRTLRQLCYLQESCDCPLKLQCDFRKGHSSFLVLQTMCFGYIFHLLQSTFFLFKVQYNSSENTNFQKLLKCNRTKILTISPKLQEWLFGHIRTFINCRSTINVIYHPQSSLQMHQMVSSI